MTFKQIEIGGRDLTLDDISQIIFEGRSIELSPDGLIKVRNSYAFLNEFSKGKLIYGINTGFGPMAQYKIAENQLVQLQYNLIRSHCCGAGRLMENMDIRALMLARINSLLRGFSGVKVELLSLLKDFINKEIYPCIYEHGGVGASGDLIQLAHLALALIGEGEVTYKDKIQAADLVFKEQNIQPLTVDKREGIAILNGTSAMTGIGAVNIIYAKKLLNWAVIFSSIIHELAGAYDDNYSEELNAVKKHKGQKQIASAMRKIVKGSKLIRKRSEHLYDKEKNQEDIITEKVQEYYSLRCVPQILGPVMDTIAFAEGVIMDEFNSVNDNPIIDIDNENVFHGGNFHGDYVSLEMDKLKLVITKLAMLAERQLNYLLNDKLNQKMPAFLNMGQLGLNYGSQGLQFTATSTVAECQSLSTSMYIHSIPNNNDNQDIVSMGANAALLTRKVIENTFQVLAIHGIAIVRAVDCLACSASLSSFSKGIYHAIRDICPNFVEDRPMHHYIKEMTEYLKNECPDVLKP